MAAEDALIAAFKVKYQRPGAVIRCERPTERKMPDSQKLEQDLKDARQEAET